MNPEIKKIATPRALRNSVEAYRVGQGETGKYLLRLPEAGETLPIEQWQFFVIEALPEFETFEGLASVFKERYGRPPMVKEVEDLLVMLDSKQLFSAGSHELPILNSINTWGSVRLAPVRTGTAGAPPVQAAGGARPVVGTPHLTPVSAKAPPEPATGAVQEEEIAGVAGAVGLDDSLPRKGFKLFDPTGLLKVSMPFLRPLRHVIYLLPLMLVTAVFIGHNQGAALADDALQVLETLSFAKHVLLAMVTVNLAATLLTALVAYHFRATVSGLCLVFYMLFLPRFAARIGNTRNLSRQALIWLHASPLLLRLGFFAGGILVWHLARMRYESLAFYGLAIASIGAISFLITANPLIKSSGFHLLAAFVNEPRLRGKSMHAFMNKFSGRLYTQADQNVLAAYAMASMLATLVFIAAMIYFLKQYLNVTLGESSLVLISALGLILLWRMSKRFNQIGRQYERSVQYLQWRNRTLPQSEPESAAREKSRPAVRYAKRAVLALFAAALFLPYSHEVGGNFRVLPFVQQRIASDIGGIIETVNFDGGEFVSKGAVIGNLSHSEFDAQEKVFAAKVEEQKSLIKELRGKPRSEELQVALSELQTQKTRTEFSRSKSERLSDLFGKGLVSLEDKENARREFEVDSNKIIEKTSTYQLIKAGATADEIAAAEAKLRAYEEERDFYRKRIEQSIFIMPFDGVLVTMRLKDKIGSYLNKGEALAVVENVNMIKAEIEIPESDITYVRAEAKVRIRSRASFDRELMGTVLSIDQNVTEQRYGRIIKVITLIDNSSDLLKTGMTGYAKIESATSPLWKILSLPLIRFAKLDLWSWLP